jgi:predicted Zn finger-like uncharacterized protein
MILTCPSCQTRYVVPDSAIGPGGRKVRCAGCRHSWFQEGAPAAEPAAAREEVPARAEDAPPPPVSFAPERRDEEEGSFLNPRPRRNPARRWTIAAIVFALLVTGAALAVNYLGLPAFAQRWLPAEQAADALGLSGTGNRSRLASGNEMLEVHGEIVNRTAETQRVPRIRAQLKDAQGRVVYSWSFAPPVSELAPHARVPFNNANVDVPRGGEVLSLAFAPLA